MKNKALLVSVTALVLTIGISSILFTKGLLSSPQADAFASSNELKGFAWSSNIGWISFNCLNTATCGSSAYKVVMDNSGNLSGYAWSSNIGWINTNPAGAAARPSDAHGLQINLSNGVMSGWMRACGGAATAATCSGGSVDGWDGWIKITDAKIATGGIIKNGAGTEGGWAWGSDVVGWVQFYNTITSNGVIVPSVDCDFTADPAGIIPPQSSKLSWSCNAYALANKCSINNGIGSNLPVSGNRTVSPTANTTYTLTCQGLGGPLAKSVDITVGSTSTPRIRIIETNP